jgi:hypothetical protein
MPVLDSKATYNNLKKKGFIDSIANSKDHKYLVYLYNGKKLFKTKLSHGSKKDIDDYLIGKMSNQCKLNKEQFVDLAKCPMTRESYIFILKEKGIF